MSVNLQQISWGYNFNQLPIKPCEMQLRFRGVIQNKCDAVVKQAAIKVCSWRTDAQMTECWHGTGVRKLYHKYARSALWVSMNTSCSPIWPVLIERVAADGGICVAGLSAQNATPHLHFASSRERGWRDYKRYPFTSVCYEMSSAKAALKANTKDKIKRVSFTVNKLSCAGLRWGKTAARLCDWLTGRISLFKAGNLVPGTWTLPREELRRF